MSRKRILLAALAAFIVSVVAMTLRDGAAASRSAAPATSLATQSGFGITAAAKTHGSVLTVMSAVTPTPAQATCGSPTYDAVSDFSATSNPNGPWSYGWEANLGGAFTLNAAERTVYQGLDTWEGPEGIFEFNFPLVSFNHTGTTLNYASGVSQPANMLNLHPSYSGKFSVVRWTAPTTGSFSVAGLFQGIDTRNTTTDVHIRQNATTALFDGNINGFGDQAPFSLVRNLAAGETLDFIVGLGSNGSFHNDSTGLAVTITTTDATCCTPPPANMVSWWPGDGNADDIQDGNDGAAQGGATFAPGKVGQAFNFNGNNQYVLIPNSPSLHVQQFTVDAWVYARSSGDLNDLIGPVIFVKDRGDNQNSPISYGLYGPGNTGQFSARIECTDGTAFNIFSSNTFEFNQWHHVAVTWDGAVARLFVNGFPERSFNIGPKTIIYSSDDAAIGRQIHLNRSFDGLIDEVEVFSRALSYAEIVAIYRADSAGKCKPLLMSCPISVTVPSTAGPWTQGLNPTFDYGSHDNTPPVVIDASSGLGFTPGANLTVTYLSGTVQAGAGYPPNDANGLPGYVRNYCENFGCFPAVYINPNAGLLAMTLVGTFANNGVIVGNPFLIGNGPTEVSIPTGANQLLLGINDTRFSDNSGSFTVAVSGVPNSTPPTISCPPPITTSADSNCQARVPDVLSGVTASGGCGGPVTLSQSPAAGTLVGLGTTTITVTATDGANNTNTCTTTFTVTDDTPPTITAPPDINVVDNAAGSCGASLDPGTPVISDNCEIASVVGTRSDGQALTASYPVGGTVITWTVTDNSGNTASAQQNVIVTNPAPAITINGPSSGALYVVNTAVNFTGSFTDNAGDSHTAVWTFDGVPQAGIVNESAQTVSASHTFDSAGVYLVTLSITDDCGQTASTNQVGDFDAFVVVYDPNAGFVTGGGWINSPTGAYVANPSLVGKANFGFISRYQKGSNVPDGQTEFQFKVANLNFHSTIYEWLVVAGARAQYKGSGTINGIGNYGFMLTAIDGETSGGGGSDKFRIKIWDKNNGDAIVYDNQIRAGIDDNPTTVLAGGSIVIHK